MAEARRRTREAEASAKEMESELSRKLADIDGERARRLAEARTAGERFLGEARRTFEKIVREIRTSGADARTIRFGRDTLERLGDRLKADAGPGAGAPVLKEGDRIRIPRLNMQGVVVEVRGDRIVADARGMRLTLEAGEVSPVDAKGGARETAPETAGGIGAWDSDAGAVAQEIDLRGYRAEEAWEALDLLIDRAIPSGLHSISIIHGVGTGRLRDYLQRKLQADKRIAAWSESTAANGGGGRTVAELAE